MWSSVRCFIFVIRSLVDMSLRLLVILICLLSRSATCVSMVSQWKCDHFEICLVFVQYPTDLVKICEDLMNFARVNVRLSFVANLCPCNVWIGLWIRLIHWNSNWNIKIPHVNIWFLQLFTINDYICKSHGMICPYIDVNGICSLCWLGIWILMEYRNTQSNNAKGHVLVSLLMKNLSVKSFTQMFLDSI